MSLYILCHLSQLSHYYQRRHRETLWLHYKKLLSICSNMFLFMENIYLCGKIKLRVFMRDRKTIINIYAMATKNARSIEEQGGLAKQSYVVLNII